jgi:hypothetical protein
MISIYENLEFILRTTVQDKICPSALDKKKPPHLWEDVGVFG